MHQARPEAPPPSHWWLALLLGLLGVVAMATAPQLPMEIGIDGATGPCARCGADPTKEFWEGYEERQSSAHGRQLLHVGGGLLLLLGGIRLGVGVDARRAAAGQSPSSLPWVLLALAWVGAFAVTPLASPGGRTIPPPVFCLCLPPAN